MKATLRIVLHALAASFGSLAIIFAVGAWRLSSGPVSLALLSPYLEEAFQAEDLDYSIIFEDTVLTWAGWERSLDIVMTDVKALGPGGVVLASVPEISLGLSGLSLLQGVVAPTGIELIGPTVELRRTPDGAFALAVGTASAGKDDAFKGFLSALLAPPDDRSSLGRLTRVSLVDAELNVKDERLGISWQAQDVNLVLDQDETGVYGTFDLEAEVAAIFTTLTGALAFERASGVVSSQVAFRDVEPARLAGLSDDFADLAALRLPVAGTVSFDMDLDGKISGVAFDLAGGEGNLDLPELFPKGFPVRQLRFAGRAHDNFRALQLDEMFIDTGGPIFEFHGLLEDAEAGIGIQATFDVTNMPFDELENYWPPSVIQTGRGWMLLNVTEGVMTQFNVRLNVKPGEFNGRFFRRDSIAGTMAFEGVTVNYFHPLPKVRGIRGTGKFSGDSIDLDMSDGKLNNIAMPAGTARMFDISSERPEMLVMIEAEGPAQEALQVLDHERLKLIRKVGLEPEQVRGHARMQFAVQFPMLTSINVGDLKVSAVAALSDLEIDDLVGNLNFSDGALRVSLDSSSMDIRGDVLIEGAPAQVQWTELFTPDAPFLSRYEVEMQVDERRQQVFGLALPRYASGTYDMQLVYTDTNREQRRAAVVLDAKATRLTLPEINWSKPKGEDATIRLLIEMPPDGSFDITSFELQSAGLHALGQARMKAIFAGLESLEVVRLQQGATDIGAVIEPRDDGGISVKVTGKSLDFRPYVDTLLKGDDGAGDGGEEPASFALDIDVERIITRSDQQLTDSRALVQNVGGEFKHVFLQGTLASGALLTVLLEPIGENRRLLVQSEDAGSVARAFDIYDNALGGTLVMEAMLHDDLPGEPITGEVVIEDYQLVNAPTLAKILGIASFTGILDALQGQGISFSTLRLPFTVENNILTVSEARTSGASLGINASGTVNLDTDEADIRGTIVPAYSINSILGNIPLIGELLVGGEGEGIFAATYSVTGPIDEPTIVVNPLAALAPGFLRNIFTIFDRPLNEGGTSEAPPPPAR